MSLKLYFHPLASYCQKALIAFYENDIPFEKETVDLSNESQFARLKKVWPIAKFPVVVDDVNHRTLPESSIIIEYLAHHYPGSQKSVLIPRDFDHALDARARDRFFDFYVADMVTKIVSDRNRPPGQSDPYGAQHAKTMLQTALTLIDEEMATKTWAVGDAFSIADCSASPSLFYANMIMPFGETHRNAKAYLTRLMERPAYARVLKEAEPYLKLVPK